MTREKAINNIKELQDTYITCRGEEDTVAVSLDGFDIEALDMAIKALEQEPRWIPVSERLPRKDGDYLVTVRNKEYGFHYIDITTYEHSEWGYKDEWQVIAWMNAPSEYKAESEDKYGNI